MLELTDENFEENIQSSAVPVLLDFYAPWCSPCFMLSPILEKLAEEYKDKVFFAKANLDAVPIAGQKFGIDSIPTVILFKEGKPVSGFIGLRPEELIRNWLKDNLSGGNLEIKNVEKIIDEFEAYAKNSGFNLNAEKKIVERVAKGLLENEKKYGKRYCPCRRVTGEEKEDSKNICPCIYHLEELEKEGHCLCQLFVK